MKLRHLVLAGSPLFHQRINLCQNILLPLREQHILVVPEIRLASIFTDKMCRVGVDGKLRHQNQKFLAALLKCFLTELKHICQIPV